MADLRDWRDDPLVLIEKRVYLVAPRLLHALHGGRDPGFVAVAAEASEALRHAQARYMGPFGVEVPASAHPLLAGLADRFERLAAAVDRDRTHPDAQARAALGDEIGLRLPVEVEAVMDALREAFVQTMLERQARAARSAETAAAEVAQISRQIYFVSINASVEAARAGDAGRGFSVIGQEIRALSEKASASLRRMSQAAAGAPP